MNPEDGSMTSTKPYLVRAIYEWILDNQMTPHLLVDARYPGTRVPAEFVEDGQIVLNIAPSAVQGLVMSNDWVQFSARFSGTARQLQIPSEAVVGIFSRENHQGMVFPPPEHPAVAAPSAADADAPPAASSRPTGIRARPKSGGPSSGKGPGSGPGKGKGGPTLKVVK
jgi:stringent starvation protein B